MMPARIPALKAARACGTKAVSPAGVISSKFAPACSESSRCRVANRYIPRIAGGPRRLCARLEQVGLGWLRIRGNRVDRHRRLRHRRQGELGVVPCPLSEQPGISFRTTAAAPVGRRTSANDCQLVAQKTEDKDSICRRECWPLRPRRGLWPNPKPPCDSSTGVPAAALALRPFQNQ